jgi:glycopeptide antibiotics resistance protein
MLEPSPEFGRQSSERAEGEIFLTFQGNNSLFFIFFTNFDMAAKRHKKHKNKISQLIISMGYEIEIQ